jgi:hypothetical protein
MMVRVVFAVVAIMLLAGLSACVPPPGSGYGPPGLSPPGYGYGSPGLPPPPPGPAGGPLFGPGPRPY